MMEMTQESTSYSGKEDYDDHATDGETGFHFLTLTLVLTLRTGMDERHGS